MLSTRAVVLAAGLSIGLGGTAFGQAAGLTPEAEARGFFLSTYVGGFTQYHRPASIAFAEDGAVIVSEYGGALLRFPNHADGHAAADGVPIAFHDYEGAYDFAQYQSGRGYRTFMSQPQLDRVVEITPDGVIEGAIFDRLPWAASMAEVPAGVRGPTAGRLLVACADGIYDIDPAQRSIGSRFSQDLVYGMQVTRDGTGLLAALPDSIRLYDLGTGAVVFDTLPSGPIAGDVRDVVQGMGGLAGQLYVSTIAGDVWEISLSDPGQRTLLISGGGPCFSMTPDPAAPGTDAGLDLPSLLICRMDEIVRLSLRDSGFFSPFGPYCPADTDRDGLVDFSDYLGFLNAYESQEPSADLDGDGIVDFIDYLAFVDAYSIGC